MHRWFTYGRPISPILGIRKETILASPSGSGSSVGLPHKAGLTVHSGSNRTCTERGIYSWHIQNKMAGIPVFEQRKGEWTQVTGDWTQVSFFNFVCRRGGCLIPALNRSAERRRLGPGLASVSWGIAFFN